MKNGFWVSGLLGFWASGLLVCWFTGLLVCWLCLSVEDFFAAEIRSSVARRNHFCQFFQRTKDYSWVIQRMCLLLNCTVFLERSDHGHWSAFCAAEIFHHYKGKFKLFYAFIFRFSLLFRIEFSHREPFIYVFRIFVVALWFFLPQWERTFLGWASHRDLSGREFLRVDILEADCPGWFRQLPR